MSINVSSASSSCDSESYDLDSDASSIDMPFYDAADDFGNRKREAGFDGDFQVPNDDLLKQIVEQVELYLSDESISRSVFLLKNLKKNKDGYLSVKLISSFRNVRKLTKDWRQVCFAIKNASTQLEVNESLSKIRRTVPFPAIDDPVCSRYIIAFGLSIDISIGKAADMFDSCGPIASIRIFRSPNSEIPGEVKRVLYEHKFDPDNCTCALIEFETLEGARNAISNNWTDNESNVNVAQVHILTRIKVSIIIINRQTQFVA
jgi:hypothetical protein